MFSYWQPCGSTLLSQLRGIPYVRSIARKIVSMKSTPLSVHIPPSLHPHPLIMYLYPHPTVSGANVITLLIFFRVFFVLGSTKTYSQVIKCTLSKLLTCNVFVLHIIDIIQWYIYKQLGSTKTKASHTIKYICPFASTPLVNAQFLHVEYIHIKYCKFNIFCVF